MAGLPSQNIQFFSFIYIPLLTLFLHLTLLGTLSYRKYIFLISLDAAAKILIATFNRYFKENITSNVIFGNFNEGAEVLTSIYALLPFPFITAVVFAITAEIICASYLKTKINKQILLPYLTIVLLFQGIGTYKVPLWQAGDTLFYDRFIKVHGYYSALLFNSLYSKKELSHEELNSRYQQLNSEDPVRTLNISFPGVTKEHNILALQVESLDYNILDFKYKGKEVTPFVNSLKKKAFFLKLYAPHTAGSGSSGADFTLLTSKLLLPDRASYKLSAIDYSSSLPQRLKSLGFSNYAFHGNDKTFWGRGSAFRKMGFENFFDVDSYSKIDTYWGVSDQLFLRETSQILQDLPNPLFALVITLSAHLPFDFVEHEFFNNDNRDLVIGYFNAINYSDQTIKEFLLNLKGKFFVVIYGDHAAGVNNSFYQSIKNKKGFVPGLILLIEEGEIYQPKINGKLEDRYYDLRSVHHLIYQVASEARQNSTSEMISSRAKNHKLKK